MLQKGFFVMATNPPEPQAVTFHGIPEVKVKGIPSLFQTVIWLVGIVLFTIGAILGGGRFVMSKSLEAMEARMGERAAKSESSLKETIANAVAPLNEDIARQRGVVRRLIYVSTLSKDERHDLTRDLELGQLRAALHNIPRSNVRKSVESLLQNKQIEKREVAHFKWNDDKNEGQIRYFELLDPTLDLSIIDLYSESNNDPCDSRVLTLPGIDPVVEACQAHLDSEKGRLELIVVRNSE